MDDDRPRSVGDSPAIAAELLRELFPHLDPRMVARVLGVRLVEEPKRATEKAAGDVDE